jgi:hypothetical protein
MHTRTNPLLNPVSKLITTNVSAARIFNVVSEKFRNEKAKVFPVLN